MLTCTFLSLVGPKVRRSSSSHFGAPILFAPRGVFVLCISFVRLTLTTDIVWLKSKTGASVSCHCLLKPVENSYFLFIVFLGFGFSFVFVLFLLRFNGSPRSLPLRLGEDLKDFLEIAREVDAQIVGPTFLRAKSGSSFLQVGGVGDGVRMGWVGG